MTGTCEACDNEDDKAFAERGVRQACSSCSTPSQVRRSFLERTFFGICAPIHADHAEQAALV